MNSDIESIKLIISTQTGRIDQVIPKMTNLSRSKVQALIKAELILVNQQKIKANYQVHRNDLIELTLPEARPLKAVAEKIPLEIIYEDDDVLVVNKPQGMVVHPSVGHARGTLVNALLNHGQILATDPNQVFRPGIVHRIDQDTSGLLMIAKNDLARISLMEQLRQHSVIRRYLAIVHGNFSESSGTIEAPIGRNPKFRQKQAVVANGKKAITHFTVKEQFDQYSLLELQLETGRTHQIRVHLAYINHPVAGDPKYGFNKTITPNHGQFLHAGVLGFVHPRTNQLKQFSSEPPEIFQQTLNKLRN